jgi:hypothetical protein
MASFINFHAAMSKTMLAVSKLKPSSKQKCSCVQERIKVVQQVKFENIANRVTQNFFATLS